MISQEPNSNVRSRRTSITLLLAFILVLLTFGTTVQAATLENAPMVRKARLLHNQRHGITPNLGMSLNHAYRHELRLGVRYDYFLMNWFGVGLDMGYTLGLNTSLGDQVVDKRVEFETTGLGFDAMASITIVPLYGKLSWLNQSSMRYDGFIRLGGGVVQLVGDGPKIENSISIAPRIGWGGHIFVKDQLAFVLEISNTLVSMSRGTTTDGGIAAEELQNIMSVNFGVLLHFPEQYEVGR
ncbi:MAG: hypothetical protein CMH54_00845 [Myxococcales bacterium]|nr:hypothetical protein [Myxococcales bacterium]|tara:strand:- start:1087 stop:1806 length:720 start_codon:yes stop_codon:yes gene_type:complete